MNAKISVFVICVEAIVYFLLDILHDCTFNKAMLSASPSLVFHTKFAISELKSK